MSVELMVMYVLTYFSWRNFNDRLWATYAASIRIKKMSELHIKFRQITIF